MVADERFKAYGTEPLNFAARFKAHGTACWGLLCSLRLTVRKFGWLEVYGRLTVRSSGPFKACGTELCFKDVRFKDYATEFWCSKNG